MIHMNHFTRLVGEEQATDLVHQIEYALASASASASVYEQLVTSNVATCTREDVREKHLARVMAQYACDNTHRRPKFLMIAGAGGEGKTYALRYLMQEFPALVTRLNWSLFYGDAEVARQLHQSSSRIFVIDDFPPDRVRSHSLKEVIGMCRPNTLIVGVSNVNVSQLNTMFDDEEGVRIRTQMFLCTSLRDVF